MRILQQDHVKTSENSTADQIGYIECKSLNCVLGKTKTMAQLVLAPKQLQCHAELIGENPVLGMARFCVQTAIPRHSVPSWQWFALAGCKT